MYVHMLCVYVALCTLPGVQGDQNSKSKSQNEVIKLYFRLYT